MSIPQVTSGDASTTNTCGVKGLVHPLMSSCTSSTTSTAIRPVTNLQVTTWPPLSATLSTNVTHSTPLLVPTSHHFMSGLRTNRPAAQGGVVILEDDANAEEDGVAHKTHPREKVHRDLPTIVLPSSSITEGTTFSSLTPVPPSKPSSISKKTFQPSAAFFFQKLPQSSHQVYLEAAPSAFTHPVAMPSSAIALPYRNGVLSAANNPSTAFGAPGVHSTHHKSSGFTRVTPPAVKIMDDLEPYLELAGRDLPLLKSAPPSRRGTVFTTVFEIVDAMSCVHFLSALPESITITIGELEDLLSDMTDPDSFSGLCRIYILLYSNLVLTAKSRETDKFQIQDRIARYLERVKHDLASTWATQEMYCISPRYHLQTMCLFVESILSSDAFREFFLRPDEQVVAVRKDRFALLSQRKSIEIKQKVVIIALEELENSISTLAAVMAEKREPKLKEDVALLVKQKNTKLLEYNALTRELNDLKKQEDDLLQDLNDLQDEIPFILGHDRNGARYYYVKLRPFPEADDVDDDYSSTVPSIDGEIEAIGCEEGISNEAPVEIISAQVAPVSANKRTVPEYIWGILVEHLPVYSWSEGSTDLDHGKPTLSYLGSLHEVQELVACLHERGLREQSLKSRLLMLIKPETYDLIKVDQGLRMFASWIFSQDTLAPSKSARRQEDIKAGQPDEALKEESSASSGQSTSSAGSVKKTKFLFVNKVFDLIHSIAKTLSIPRVAGNWRSSIDPTTPETLVTTSLAVLSPWLEEFAPLGYFEPRSLNEYERRVTLSSLSSLCRWLDELATAVAIKKPMVDRILSKARAQQPRRSLDSSQSASSRISSSRRVSAPPRPSNKRKAQRSRSEMSGEENEDEENSSSDELVKSRLAGKKSKHSSSRSAHQKARVYANDDSESQERDDSSENETVGSSDNDNETHKAANTSIVFEDQEVAAEEEEEIVLARGSVASRSFGSPSVSASPHRRNRNFIPKILPNKTRGVGKKQTKYNDRTGDDSESEVMPAPSRRATRSTAPNVPEPVYTRKRIGTADVGRSGGKVDKRSLSKVKEQDHQRIRTIIDSDSD